MSAPVSEPELLRDYLVNRLETRSDFRDAKILSRKTADLQNEIERGLEREGLLVLVMIPEMRPLGNQSAQTVLDPVRVRFRVSENVLINRANGGPGALHIACRIVAEMNMHKPPMPWAGLLVPESPGMRELNIIAGLEEDDDSDDYAGWDVFFQTKISIQPRNTTH